jgi:hypothetical protein
MKSGILLKKRLSRRARKRIIGGLIVDNDHVSETISTAREQMIAARFGVGRLQFTVGAHHTYFFIPGRAPQQHAPIMITREAGVRLPFSENAPACSGRRSRGIEIMNFWSVLYRN